MVAYSIRRILTLASCLAYCAFAIGSAGAFASAGGGDDPAAGQLTLVKVNKADRGNFDLAFRSIAEQGHVTILAEGVPIHPLLTDKQRAALDEAAPADKSITVDQILPIEAHAFDYDVEKFAPNIYLLRKRYSDVNELPCVTFEEMQNALRQIYRLGCMYGGEPAIPSGPANPTQRFYQALTPQQREAAADGLTLAQLTPEQQALARAAAGCWHGSLSTTIQANARSIRWA